MNDALKISVVIPTYNRVEMLLNCLDALSRQSLPFSQFEVLVVDDGSQDETSKRVKERSFPYAFKFLQEKHGGAASARNRGIKEAKGEIILFTDDDCIPSEGLLEEHAKAHESEAMRVVRGPVVIVRSPSEISNGKFRLSHFSMNFFCTSNASVRKEWLLKAGGFDESFGRWEDAELGWRLRHMGLKRVFLPHAPVFHWKPEWPVGKLVKTALADGRAAANLYKRHPGLRTWLAGGLHPISLAAGLFLKPLVAWKMAGMHPEETVSGLWERLIFHAYFVQGLKEKNL
jgi:glycosyltransferase involved in cell wall biosynthesis